MAILRQVINEGAKTGRSLSHPPALAHLSRQFKRDYGLTPSAYLRQLRVADAPLRLAAGQPIVVIIKSTEVMLGRE